MFNKIEERAAGLTWSFRKAFWKWEGAFPDLVECAEHGEQARSWFPDEVQVLAGIDAQTLRDRQSLIRN